MSDRYSNRREDFLPALRFQKSPYYQRIHFKTTPPLPTYLFTFSAGVFNVNLYEGIHIFHREEDSLKIVQKESVKYIFTALEKITEIQQTGDIFFPKQWAMALLSGYHSLEAREQIALFWQYNRGRIPESLGLKIRQASAHLYWGYTVSGGQRLFLRD